jgi:hypothetical protein
MRITVRSIVAGFSLLAFGFVAGALASDAMGKGVIQWTMADLKWQAMPGGPGMAAAA